MACIVKPHGDPGRAKSTFGLISFGLSDVRHSDLSNYERSAQPFIIWRRNLVKSYGVKPMVLPRPEERMPVDLSPTVVSLSE